jgi:hypothetical protein
MKKVPVVILIIGIWLPSCVKWDLEKFPLNTFSQNYPVSPSIDTQYAHQFIQITDGTFRIIGTNTKQEINLLQVSADGKSANLEISPGAGKAADIQNGIGQNAFGTLIQRKEGITFLQYSNGVSPSLQSVVSGDLSKKFPLIESSEGFHCSTTKDGNWIIAGTMKQSTQDSRLFMSSLKAGGGSDWIHTYETNIQPIGGYLSDNGTYFLLTARPNGNALLLRFTNKGTLTLSKPLQNIYLSKEGGITGNGKSIFITAAQKTLKGYKTSVTSYSLNGDREWEFTKESNLGLSKGIKILCEKEGQIILLEREGNISSNQNYNHKLIRLNAAGELLWESVFLPEKPNEKIVDLIISNDFGYAMLGIDPTGYKIVKTDIFGKIKP